MGLEEVSLHSSHGEITERIEALSVADQARLLKVAGYYAPRTSMQPNDLLQEAMVRAIDGTRLCPPDVPVVKFLANTMRSIVRGELDKEERREVDGGLETPIVDYNLFSDMHADPAQSQEDELIQIEGDDAFHNWLTDQFADDDDGMIVLLGMFENLKGQKLCEETGFNTEELATIRRRIKRKIPTLRKPDRS